MVSASKLNLSNEYLAQVTGIPIEDIIEFDNDTSDPGEVAQSIRHDEIKSAIRTAIYEELEKHYRRSAYIMSDMLQTRDYEHLSLSRLQQKGRFGKKWLFEARTRSSKHQFTITAVDDTPLLAMNRASVEIHIGYGVLKTHHDNGLFMSSEEEVTP